jgi:ribosomal protein S12 methylthiotransferase
MDNQIDEEVKIKRKNIILDMQRDISEEKCKDFIGKEIEVIVEGRFENNGKKTYLCRSYRDCYEVDGYVFLDSENEYMSGDYVKVFVTGASYYDLIGVEADESAQ